MVYVKKVSIDIWVTDVSDGIRKFSSYKESTEGLKPIKNGQIFWKKNNIN